jgi:hypothetical protein
MSTRFSGSAVYLFHSLLSLTSGGISASRFCGVGSSSMQPTTACRVGRWVDHVTQWEDVAHQLNHEMC